MTGLVGPHGKVRCMPPIDGPARAAYHSTGHLSCQVVRASWSARLMEFPKVKPANRPGGWEVEGVGYRRQAHLCLLAFEQKNALLQKHLERLEQARKKGGTYKIPPNLLEKYRFFRSAAVVYSAMAVEGFLNYYGVKRLGNDFYRDTYERLSSHRKLAAVVATCTGHLLPRHAELVTVLRRLTERRNALVHPKAREVLPKAKGVQPRRAPLHSAEAPTSAADSVRDMERFFKLFAKLDPQAVSAILW